MSSENPRFGLHLVFVRAPRSGAQRCGETRSAQRVVSFAQRAAVRVVSCSHRFQRSRMAHQGSRGHQATLGAPARSAAKRRRAAWSVAKRRSALEKSVFSALSADAASQDTRSGQGEASAQRSQRAALAQPTLMTMPGGASAQRWTGGAHQSAEPARSTGASISGASAQRCRSRR